MGALSDMAYATRSATARAEHYRNWPIFTVTPKKMSKAEVGPLVNKSGLKRSRYGKDTGSFRIATTNLYRFNLITYATDQAILSLAVPTANVAAYYPTTTVPASTAAVWSDVPAEDPVNYKALRPRTSNIGGTNTLRTMGAKWMISEEIALPAYPWYSTFLGFKLDASGFNCCDPLQFSTLVSQFEKVKQGPYSMTFSFKEPPLGNFVPYRQYPLSTQIGPISGTAAANAEYHAMGQWEYMIIPARYNASVQLPTCMGTKQWDRLMDMGFKPRRCGQSHTIYCAMEGADQDQIAYVRALTKSKADASDNGYTLASIQGKRIKHQWRDTETSCQAYYTEGQPDQCIDAAGIQEQMGRTVTAQSFGCQPFGSAIIFNFKQYAPVTTMEAAAGLQTARREHISIEITVCSYTKFKSPNLEQQDLDQFNPNPFQQ